MKSVSMDDQLEGQILTMVALQTTKLSFYEILLFLVCGV